MKKRIFLASAITALALGVTSCNMDLRPYGTIEPENAFQSIADAEKLRNGLYTCFRAYSGGAFANRDEIRSDLYHATVGFGNNGGTMYRWMFTTADGDVSSIWAGAYQTISNANYFIEQANAVNKEDWSDNDRANLQVWKGEAYFLRAYYHYELARFFCLDYVGNESSMGIPYITLYSPSSDAADYPSRGTLEETYTKIKADLDSARVLVTTAGTVGANRITADAITAFSARLALATGDYTTAEAEAGSLIDSGKYPLIAAGDTAAFRNMWVNDSGTECILQLEASYPNELGTSYDYTYLGYNSTENRYSPAFIPEQWVIELFTGLDANDIRYQQLFTTKTISGGGGATFDNIVLLNKFPGNPALRSSDTDQNYQHKPKIFRIAEMYLIRAEANLRSGNASAAASDISTLREHRIPNYLRISSITEDELLDERVRELIGEGFRIGDLKRFKHDLQRGAAQQTSDCIYLPSENTTFYRSYTDYMMIFPIPQEEIDSNPHIVQNSGYSD